ncbi:MAG: hypothetical protein ACI9U2_004898, partial [Bradymonadia bacterium]
MQLLIAKIGIDSNNAPGAQREVSAGRAKMAMVNTKLAQRACPQRLGQRPQFVAQRMVLAPDQAK